MLFMKRNRILWHGVHFLEWNEACGVKLFPVKSLLKHYQPVQCFSSFLVGSLNRYHGHWIMCGESEEK